MNFENAGAHSEKEPNRVEATQEIVPEEPVIVEMERDMQRLSLDGAEIDRILEKLPADDAVAIEAHERQSGIRARVGSILQNAALSLSLLSAPSLVHAQEGAPTTPEHTRSHVELEYDNPQRSAYESPEKYMQYVSGEYKRYMNSTQTSISQLLAGTEPLSHAMYPAVGEPDTKAIQAAFEPIVATHSRARLQSDSERQWMADVYYSPEHVQRLRDEEYSDEQIKDILSRVQQDKIDILPGEDLGSSDGIYHPSEYYDADDPLAAINDRIRIDDSLENAVTIHELQHRTKRGEVSSRARALYAEAFDGTHYLDKGFIEDGRSMVEYLQTPTELDARKKELEYDLERHTDWKYGQPFTPKQIEQLQQLRKQGLLSYGSEQFLNVIKPEYLERIMNELADTKDSSEQEHIA